MKDTNLKMTLEIEVSGSEGWQERMAEALQEIGALVSDKQGRGWLRDKGDAANYSYEYSIKAEK